MQTFPLSLLLLLTCVFSLNAQNVREITHEGYSIKASLNVDGIENATALLAAGEIPMKDAKKPNYLFGLLYKDAERNGSKIIVAEILDAATNKSIKKITLDEFLGKTNSQWKENENSATSRSYQFSSGGAKYLFVNEVTSSVDRDFPTGKKMEMRFSVVPPKDQNLRVKIYGKLDGIPSEKNTIVTVSAEQNASKLLPAIVYQFPSGSKIDLATASKKQSEISLTVTGPSKNCSANATSEVFSITIAGTSVPFTKDVAKQVANIEQFFAGKRNSPELVAETIVTPAKPTPNDTITYTLIYHNIGSAAAADITISNPIPQNTLYVDKSAEGEGSTISFIREKVNLPKIGLIQSISWNFKAPIYPGEERSAKFKVYLK